MGVPPGHPTMKLAMEKITWYIRNDHKTVNEMDWTGPYVLKRAFNNFRKFREDKKWNPGTYQYNGEKMLLLKECSSGHVWVSFNCDNRNEVLFYSKYPEYRGELKQEYWVIELKNSGEQAWKKECIQNVDPL